MNSTTSADGATNNTQLKSLAIYQKTTRTCKRLVKASHYQIIPEPK